MIKYYCDICGNEIAKSNIIGKDVGTKLVINNMNYCSETHLLICQDCYQYIENAIGDRRRAKNAN